MKSTNLRLPDELHRLATDEVARRKRLDPGASLNSLILEALAAYLKHLHSSSTHAPSE